MFDNQNTLNRYDAIVIGSGISGLTISLILAKEGKKVALLEKDRDIDPLIRPYQRKGCEFSPGLHIMGWMNEGEVISSFFKYLNIDDGVDKELRENGFGDIVIGSDKYHIPKGFQNVENSLLSYFPESAEAVRNYIHSVRKVNAETFYINHKLKPNINNHHHFGELDNFSLQSFLQQYSASQKLIHLLGTFNYILMGSKADEVPFLTHAFVLGGFYQSPGTLKVSGMNKLLSNFKRELVRYQVDLFTHCEVDEILIDNERNAFGIKTVDGVNYFSSNIIASFNPKILNEKVKHNLRQIYRRRLNEAENTFGLYVAFYKMNSPDAKIDNFLYTDENMDIALGAIINTSGENRILSVFLVDNDSDIPAGIEERQICSKRKLELLENIIFDKAPDLKGNVILLDFLKPWTFERYTNTINGSAYSIKHTSNTLGFQQRVPIRGVYLVGQAIYPGFLGSMVSSFSLALQLLETDDFWSRVTNQ